MLLESIQSNQSIKIRNRIWQYPELDIGQEGGGRGWLIAIRIVRDMNKVFVYGTLKRGFYNHHLLIDRTKGCSIFIGDAILESCHALVAMPLDGLPCLIPVEAEVEAKPLIVCIL